MTKEQKDQAWSRLPRSYRESVKHMYRMITRPTTLEIFSDARKLLKALFGEHNLTSEEVLPELICAEKAKVQQLYSTKDYVKSDDVLLVMNDLFGKENIKFSPGDKVRVVFSIYNKDRKYDVIRSSVYNTKRKCMIYTLEEICDDFGEYTWFFDEDLKYYNPEDPDISYYETVDKLLEE